LHPELIQAIAVSELLLEGWIESLRQATCDLSTLTHQIISTIAETGGLNAAELYKRLCEFGPFCAVEPALFTRLLRCLGSADVVEQTGQGDLILGLVGERLRSERDFYAAFQTPVEFAVLHVRRNIGTLPLRAIPEPGEHIILAGRRWKVVQADMVRGEVHVEPAAGRKRPHFLGELGDIDDRVRERMREVLRDSRVYRYLNPVAAQLVDHARRSAAEAGVLDHALQSVSDRQTRWFPWNGTRAQRTLVAMLTGAGVGATTRSVAIDIEASRGDVRDLIGTFVQAPSSALAIATHVQPKQRRKYDRFLTDDLLDVGIARDTLDLTGALSACSAALASPPPGSRK
jgi:ATP-dependent Lhr-like helicase